MKHLVLPLHVALAAAIAFLASGCGQTGPLYLPNSGQSAPASAVTAPAPVPGTVPAANDAQLQRPAPTTTIPYPGTR
ncbi:LPS translocon maturation chaperone LptM [Lacisediminimonas profundi]|uniref:LPS translocon maturation chaperone LptM n=1 Tax=Lacisediminimonas profundi TaxID=2603856 RepID=UPI0013870638|nr:lipoprotein [Lacisediminimonas profundi]